MPSTPSSQPREPTPFEKFAALTKRVIATSKKEIDKREKEYRRERKEKTRGEHS
jgi:hypothetical protein